MRNNATTTIVGNGNAVVNGGGHASVTINNSSVGGSIVTGTIYTNTDWVGRKRK
jgi:hypothetical protein